MLKAMSKVKAVSPRRTDSAIRTDRKLRRGSSWPSKFEASGVTSGFSDAISREMFTEQLGDVEDL